MANENMNKAHAQGRRCTIDLTPAAAQELDRICSTFNLKISELFRYSLLLMRIYHDAVLGGKQMRLVSRTDPNEIQVVELPLFAVPSSSVERAIAEEINVERTERV